MDSRTILLGAGASAEASVPTVKDMVPKIYSLLSGDRYRWETIEHAFNTAVGGIRSYNAVEKRNPLGSIDIEELYRVLIDLANRNQNYLSPFIGAWSRAVLSAESQDLSDAASEIADALSEDVSQLARSVGRDWDLRGINSRVEFGNFRRKLQSTLKRTSGTGSGQAFQAAANAILATLAKLCWIKDPQKVSYLAPLMSANSPIWVATLNYDNSVELAAKANGVTCHRVHADLSASDSQSARVTLAKLHGSIDWALNHNWDIQPKNSPAENPALLFGAGDKLKVQGPYLDLLFAFRQRLAISSEVHICGYSFRDAHVNHFLLQWLDQNPKLNIDVFDPYLSADALVENFAGTLEKGRTLNGAAFMGRIRLNAMSTGDWAKRYSEEDSPSFKQ
jgi:hypothetical protein